MFTRSVNGLNNQHLFFSVDYVLYTEGGSKSFTQEEILDGEYSEWTDDIVFWNNIFTEIKPKLKIKFKSIGSKDNVKAMAEKIRDEDLKNVIAAMDSEHDQIFSNTIPHNNILYTYGYSWENDVWDTSLIKDVVITISGFQIEDDDLENNFNTLIEEIKPLVYADIKLFEERSSFFPRKMGTLSFVNCKPVYLPHLIQEKIDEKFEEKQVNKEEVFAFGDKIKANSRKNCYGHFLADYCFQLIYKYIYTKFKLKSISKDVIFRIALNIYFTKYFTTSDRYNYYSDRLNNLYSA